MIEPDVPDNEDKRLAALYALDILDSIREDRFERITGLARKIFNVPISAISLVDRDRQWFKSIQGIDVCQTPRNVSFCGHAILQGDIYLVPNALEHPVFSDNPLVVGPPHIRFYAGAPLRSPTGERIGTLCVIDAKPRDFDAAQCDILRNLADMVEHELFLKEVFLSQDLSKRIGKELTVFRNIFENSHESIDIMDEHGRIIYCNPARERLVGMDKADVVSKHFTTFIAPSATQQMTKIRQALDEGRGWKGNVPIRKQDGSFFMSHSNFGLIHGEDGKIQNIFNIFRDVTKDVARMAELSVAHEAVKVANLSKVEFLSSMSHELRTPLNAIIGFSEILINGKADKLAERQLGYVEYIRKGGEYLLSMINEILEFSKLEAGKVTLSIENMSLNDLVYECLHLSERILAKFGVTLINEIPSGVPYLFADRLKTQQVLLNLINNAAKYNRPGGTIRLTFSTTDNGFAKIGIADTGIGIEESKQSELFQPFNRLGAEFSDIEGTGIGLALVQKLVQLMGGDVDFQSVHGEGTTFWISLPLADVQPSRTQANLLPDSTQGSIDPQSNDMVLLYIEDNPDNIHLMGCFVESLSGWSLIVAKTAEAGIELAKTEAPNLIICDINLPGMNGIEAVRALRSLSQVGGSLPIYALSADATSKTISDAMTAGFTKYLTKPIRLRDLKSEMNQLMVALT